ncbi:MAG TPA: helix-turn-helix transcriptional regulator [Candidatus Binatus sp.]|nr:helix-turn-helix transcriptional regulator [Candidatus Binatus sp.]
MLHEIECAPRSRVHLGPALRPTMTITLAGSALEIGDRTSAHRISTCSFEPAAHARLIHIPDGGWRAAIVGLGEPWALDPVRDLNLRAPCSSNSGWVYRLSGRLERELLHADFASSVAIAGILVQMLSELARTADGARERRPRWLEGLRMHLEQDFRSPVRLQELARGANVHPAHLSKAFLRAFGCTVGEFIREQRVEYARRQLETTALTLSEIAVAAGFADQSHFAKTFKRLIGLSPSDYRTATGERYGP